MSGCEGCFLSAKGQANELANIREKAKAYANEQNTTVAIYKEANEYRCIRADEAAGLPVMEYISVTH